MLIPLMRPKLPALPAVAKYLQEMDSSRIYANNGPLVKKLEARIARAFQIKPSQVVTTTSATIAIQGAATISETKSFNVPSFTFAATPTGIANSGKHLRFIDSVRETMDISLRDLSLVDGGVVDVRPFGAPIRVVSDWKSREVIVDAAASMGRENMDFSGLPPSWTVVFSLHATKPVAAGEGGIAIFGDENRADEFRRWTNFGFSKTRASVILGTNGKMSEMSAAYAHASLDEFQRNKNSWATIKSAQRDIELNHNLWGINTEPGNDPYWIIRFQRRKTALSFARHCTASGIETRFWWPTPCHQMLAFSDADPSTKNFPVAEFLSGTVLGLPHFPEMSIAEFTLIGNAIAKFSPSTGVGVIG